MRNSDKVWLAFNRKESTPGNIFSSFVAGYFGIGIGFGIWLLVLGTTILSISAGALAWTPNVIALLLVPLACLIGLLEFFRRLHKKEGYVEAVHKHYLERRKIRLERIAKKD